MELRTFGKTRFEVTSRTTFGKQGHRIFNRNGEAFDKGETYSGGPSDIGLKTLEKIRQLHSVQTYLAPLNLRWVLDHLEIRTVIPSDSRQGQQKKILKRLKSPLWIEISPKPRQKCVMLLIKLLVYHQ